MKLNRNSDTPLHEQAENVLRKLIESDEYKSGKLLPKEIDLSKQLNISRNTLRQATSRLVSEGLLVRKKGVGTRVARKGISVSAKNWLSFSQEMKMMGIAVRNFDLHLYYKVPGTEIANFFGIADTFEKCLVLERLRGSLENPFVFFISYFNPALHLSGDDNFTKPLYEMLEQDKGIIVKTSKEEISAILAGDYLAERLEVSPTDPILVRKRFVYDDKGYPIEYNVGYYRSDSFTYTIEATR